MRKGMPGKCPYCDKRRCASICQRPPCDVCGRRRCYGCTGSAAELARKAMARTKPERGELTEYQRRMLDYIRAYIQDHEYPPVLAEIAAALKGNLSNVHYHVKELQLKGYITRRMDRHIVRSIQLTEKARALYAEP